MAVPEQYTGDLYPCMMGCNPLMFGCIFSQKNASIKASKEKEDKPMDVDPIVIHIVSMLEDLNGDALRAVYMVVRELHRKQTPCIQSITKNS